MFYFFDFKTKTIHFAPISEIHRNTHLINNEWVFHKCAFILVTVYLFCFVFTLVIMFLVLTLILSKIPASQAVLGSFLVVFANTQITVAIINIKTICEILHNILLQKNIK